MRRRQLTRKRDGTSVKAVVETSQGPRGVPLSRTTRAHYLETIALFIKTILRKVLSVNLNRAGFFGKMRCALLCFGKSKSLRQRENLKNLGPAGMVSYGALNSCYYTCAYIYCLQRVRVLYDPRVLSLMSPVVKPHFARALSRGRCASLGMLLH